MTDQQLYLSIGIPMLFNFGLFMALRWEMVARFEAVDKRFDSMDKLFTEKLLRVEQVLDARVQTIEERTK